MDNKKLLIDNKFLRKLNKHLRDERDKLSADINIREIAIKS